MKPKHRIYCPQCKRQKMLFESESKAKNFIKFNAQEIKRTNKYAPNRAYYCVACGGWHVTKSPIFSATNLIKTDNFANFTSVI